MDKRAKAVATALTQIDRLASAVLSNQEEWGLPKAFATSLVTQLDKVADSLEEGTFGEEAFIQRQASILNRTAKTFGTQEALDAYLKAHPNADKSKHKVDSDDEDTKKLKKDLGAFQGIQKGQAKSDKGKEKRKQEKGKKEDSDHFDKLKKDLESWRDAK